MKFVKSTILGVAIAASLLAPSPSLAQQMPSNARRVSGCILEIDRTARILKIRDVRSGTIVTAHVPPGQKLMLLENANPAGYPKSIPFELAIRGLTVDLTVLPAAP